MSSDNVLTGCKREIFIWEAANLLRYSDITLNQGSWINTSQKSNDFENHFGTSFFLLNYL